MNFNAIIIEQVSKDECKPFKNTNELLTISLLIPSGSTNTLFISVSEYWIFASSPTLSGHILLSCKVVA